jgi:tetratricopeptide (TPR) repeat protein
MPFGVKTGHGGTPIDFDQVYDQMIRPAVEAAGLEPIRADEERVGGSIHKPMFERLQLCEFAVADLTSGNANVFYELGIRHALRPSTTVMIYQNDYTLPFDVASMRGLPYNSRSLQDGRAALTERLRQARSHDQDSPVYEYLSDLPRHQLDHSKTDLFREHVEYSKKMKQSLAAACVLGQAGVAQLNEIRQAIGNLADCEAGVLVDLYLSYRKLEAYSEMETLYHQLPKPLSHNRIVREQLAFALNRLGRRVEARDILEELIAANGPNPETNGLLGRIYKDLYKAEAAQSPSGAKPSILARGHLKMAIETYLKGFQADWRDAYPGINAVSLMELMDPPDRRQAELLPVVAFAVRQKVAQRDGDYWDYATLLELAVLAADEEAAIQYLSDALPLATKLGDQWAPKTTADNLGLIRTKRIARGLPMEWVEEIEAELYQATERLRHGDA